MVTVHLDMTEHEALQLQELMRRITIDAGGKVSLTGVMVDFSLVPSNGSIDVAIFRAIEEALSE